MNNKCEAIMFSKSEISSIEVTLTEANQDLESSRETMKKLEVILRKAQEGWKKAKDGLWEMRLENLDLFKKYMKSVEHNFSILQVSFKDGQGCHFDFHHFLFVFTLLSALQIFLYPLCFRHFSTYCYKFIMKIMIL